MPLLVLSLSPEYGLVQTGDQCKLTAGLFLQVFESPLQLQPRLALSHIQPSSSQAANPIPHGLERAQQCRAAIARYLPLSYFL